MSRADLVVALDEARTLAMGPIIETAPITDAPAIAPLLLRILTAASDTPEVLAELADVPAARALLRITDAAAAIEFQAGEGRLHAESADVKGRGPKVDATARTWLGLLGGTLRPWLAFTRGLVICRAGLTELRWMQTVAERLQRGYEATRH
ncbi:MAG: hypothetical protein HYX56_04420 [Chloroflexi bacterium]|nr:hypothetical protein [Chloroflexota bacterium]